MCYSVSPVRITGNRMRRRVVVAVMYYSGLHVNITGNRMKQRVIVAKLSG